MEMIKAGPIGTMSETDTHWEDKGNTMLSHIFVSFYSSHITAIQFGYSDKGALVMSEKYGGPSEGHNFRVVKLKHNEYVTGLSGESNRYGINSLTCYTNLGKHVLICERNCYYSTSSKKEIDLAITDRREFGGFFGSCDKSNLKSIGIYLSPIPSSDTAVKREKV